MRTLVAVALILSLAVLVVRPVLAQGGVNTSAPVPQDPNALVTKVERIVGLLGQIFAFLMIGVVILLAIKFAYSTGNPHARAECVQWAVFAVIGMVLGFGARWIVGMAQWIAEKM